MIRLCFTNFYNTRHTYSNITYHIGSSAVKILRVRLAILNCKQAINNCIVYYFRNTWKQIVCSMGSGAEEEGASIEEGAKSIEGSDQSIWLLLWCSRIGTLYAGAGFANGAATVPA